LLSLDQPEHPDPEFRPKSLPAERRSAGVIPRNGGRLAPCTSITSRASDGSWAPSVMTVPSSIAVSGEAALFPGEFNGTLEA
jgi:hypothetical protein